MKRILVLLLVAVAVVGITANCNKVNALRNKHNRFDSVPVEVDTISKFSQELGHFIDSICPTLNGTLIIARHDTILVERAMGYLQLFREATGYDTITYEQLGGLRKQDVNKVTMESLFDLASVSKQFTAAAVLKLCSEGELKLTDSLCKFYPNIPYKNVTIRQLLNHTSGIPEYFNFDFKLYDTTFFIDNAQLIRVLEKQRFPRMFVRGTQFKYVNTNYAILADIVEKVSGYPFEYYVRTNLWEPAGMKNTRFFTEIVGIAPVDALQHAPAEKGQEYVIAYPMDGMSKVPVARGHWKSGALAQYDRLNGILGDKGVYASAEDLIKWTNAYYIEHKIIPEEWIKKATQYQNKLNNGTQPAEGYGYGVRMEEKEESGFVVFHGGLWDGFHNVWLYRPSDGLQIVFLSNFYNRSHTGKCDLILNYVDSLSHR